MICWRKQQTAKEKKHGAGFDSYIKNYSTTNSEIFSFFSK